VRQLEQQLAARDHELVTLQEEVNELRALIGGVATELLKAWPKRPIVYKTDVPGSLGWYVAELIRDRDRTVALEQQLAVLQAEAERLQAVNTDLEINSVAYGFELRCARSQLAARDAEVARLRKALDRLTWVVENPVGFAVCRGCRITRDLWGSNDARHEADCFIAAALATPDKGEE